MRETEVWAIHRAACDAGEHHYRDPDSGLRVFTAFGLKKRGECCGSGCRHCPFAHDAIEIVDRSKKARQPTWLTATRPTGEAQDILFWSGGKDSFLAYRQLRRDKQAPIVLLTTFDGQSRRVAHQEVMIDDVVMQATSLGVPLLGVPLYPGMSYENRIGEAICLVPRVNQLVFGDLHLQHIREWREQAFEPLVDELGIGIEFPLWQKPYSELMLDLERSEIRCEISAVDPRWAGSIRVGDVYDREFVSRLPADVDPFGEQGEFHTLALI